MLVLNYVMPVYIYVVMSTSVISATYECSFEIKNRDIMIFCQTMDKYLVKYGHFSLPLLYFV